MEAVPRLPMVCFEMRLCVENAEFSTKLKQYIKKHYNEDPTLYAAGITGIDSMRREAVSPSKSSVGCSVMKRYFCQLHFLGSRFPMRENEEAAVSFVWKNLFSTSTLTMNDICLEKLSILYNIGALHTQLGAMDNRATTEGMKMSCTHFQCAAWAFQHIIEDYPNCKSFGLSPVMISFMYQLSLGQAQECLLEKCMMDNRKSAISAKIGVQVVDYYKQSLSLLLEWPQNEDVPTNVTNLKEYKNWSKYLQFKITYYESISLLFQGQQAEDQQKMGERVAFYQAAFEKLQEAESLPSGVDNTENVVEAVTFVCSVIEAKRKAAKNENEFIYHEDIPNISHLPKIKGASLVKGIPFNINDPDVCGPDLFSSIVPMEVHEYASLYSEEKAKILRKVNGMIESKDEELETFLSMLDLDDIKAKLNGNKLPQDLIDRCATLNAKPDAIQHLLDVMNKLADVYQEVESMLNDMKKILNEEDNREKEYQQKLGKRPPSIAATDLTREAKKYQEAHAKASESNQTLHKAMVMHISNLKLLSLSLKELQNHIPPISESSEVEVITTEIEHLMSKIEEMKQQRLLLAGEMRDLACQDDITRQLLTHSSNKVQELFAQELKKYDKYVSLIEQNLAAQENILRALKVSYANYGSTRKTTLESQRKRSIFISSLIASYDAYEDLLNKSSKGLDFYKKLEANVSKLLQRVKGTCKVQDEEREQMLKSVTKSEAGTTHSDVPISNNLKLKDYLNIKKETGKLSLDQSSAASSITPYLSDTNLSQQNWIPGVRPAPVGSEETNSAFPTASDSFHGFYQSQGKDQVWSNSYYSSPQDTDQKLKYFLPQANNSYVNHPQNLTNLCNQDAYPISSYSTVLPKNEGQSIYEPKSNYYDVRGPPNRSCSSESTTLPTAANYTYSVSGIGNPQLPLPNPHAKTVHPEMSPYGGYPARIPDSRAAPQQPYSSLTSQPELTTANYGTTGQFYETQISSSYNVSAFPPPHVPYVSSNSISTSYNSNVCPSPQLQPSTSYNSFPMSQSADVYDFSVSNSSSSSTHMPLPAYRTEAQDSSTKTVTATSTNCSPHDQIHIYQNAQNIQPLPGNFVNNNQDCVQAAVPQSSFFAGAICSGTYGDCQSLAASTQYIPQPWSSSYSSSHSQYLHSGNETLYTSSPILNQFSTTNSFIYKANEPQVSNASRCDPYAGQYYSNQYGTYTGQTDFNSQNGNPLTYMLAGMDRQEDTTTTTYSNFEAKSSPATSSSNMDLLAGLDFNISHSPLLPESTAVSNNKEIQPTEILVKSTTSAQPAEDIPSQKSDSTKNVIQEEISSKNFLSTNENVTHFSQEVEKYEKFVEGLTLKTLNGPTPLDLKWKEIVDVQDKISPHRIISVARCYPMKNRFSDILPYDDSRVELPSTKDDYINASRMTDLTKLSPPFILTQAPLPSTYADFWAMVFEQQVEVIVCLLSDSELDGHIYWPSEKSRELEIGKLRICLQSSNVRSYWVERILSVSVMESKATRVVIHLQFVAWPGSAFPESPGPFLVFAAECISFFMQQRSYHHPVTVHCISGVGRSGLFCLIIASMLEIQAGKGIPDLAALSARMCQFRKSCLRDREHLKFAYQTVLYYSQDLLMKRGILTNRNQSFEEKNTRDGKCHTRHPSEDYLVASQLQAGIENLAIDPSSKVVDAEERNAGAFSADAYHCVKDSISCGSSPRNSASLPLEAHGLVNAPPKVDIYGKNIKKSGTGTVIASQSLNDDPLSQLDPLWTMKK